MIVVSASAPRSGSRWYLKMSNDLLVAAGYNDLNQIQEQFHLNNVIQGTLVRDALQYKKLLRLIYPHFWGKTYVFRTHSTPTRGLRILTRMGIFKSTYIYRDPRDRLVSLIDLQRDVREQGVVDKNKPLSTFDEMLNELKGSHAQYTAWLNHPYTLLVRYEDLMNNSVKELQRLTAFLQLDVKETVLHDIAAKYDRKTQAANPGAVQSHLNVGKIGRYLDILNDEQIERMNREMRLAITTLGYEI